MTESFEITKNNTFEQMKTNFILFLFMLSHSHNTTKCSILLM